ncbi:cytochrome P450 [Nostoc sp. CHAB 5844]|nr:cytochrome P450 [Nostoc sp. CHAB 5844]
MSYLEQYDSIPVDNVAEKVKLVNQGIWTDWRGLFKELRENRPIFVTPKFVLVSLFPDVQEVLSRSEVFSVRLFAPKMDPVVGPCMLARDNTEVNYREKSIMKTMLQLEDLPIVRKMAGEIAKAALDKSASTGKIEVVNELGKYVPVKICGDYFGFPGPNLETMYRWAKTTQDDMFRNLTNDPKIHEASVQTGQEMRNYLAELLQQKKAQKGKTALEKGISVTVTTPNLTKEISLGNTTKSITSAPKDIFSRLATTSFASDIPFDESKILTNMAMLLIGSVETTAQAITQTLEQILKRRDILPKVLAAAQSNDNQTFDKYVWEALRFNPFSPFVVRFCESDYTLAPGTPRATRIPAKSVVLAGLGSAMFDGAVVVNPDDFSVERPKYNYMHFGYGHHTCLGEHVSGVVIPEVIKQILLRPSVKLIPGEEGKIDYQGTLIPQRFVIAYDK